MKPHRLTLTNTLIMGYGLDKQIHNIYNPRPATQAELEAYHDHDYIDFLSRSESCLHFLILNSTRPQSHSTKSD
jgi:acetoin utilization deacetylase AcuC-like enzyme